MTDGPDESQMSTAVRVASATGLFLAALVLMPILLLAGAWGLVAVDWASGWGAVIVLFGSGTLATVALLSSPRLRPAGVGALLGLVLSGAATFFYAVVLQATDF